MKNSMKIRIGLLAFLLSLTGLCFGQKADEKKSVGIKKISAVEQEQTQDAVKFKRNRSLDFSNESKKSEIKIVSTTEYNYLIIKVWCSLFNGNALLEIIDPKGDVKGTFKIKSDDTVVMGDQTKTNGTVVGEMEKIFSEPIPGEWIFRAKPSTAKGHLELTIYQGYEPEVNMLYLRNLIR